MLRGGHWLGQNWDRVQTLFFSLRKHRAWPTRRTGLTTATTFLPKPWGSTCSLHDASLPNWSQVASSGPVPLAYPHTVTHTQPGAAPQKFLFLASCGGGGILLPTSFSLPGLISPSHISPDSICVSSLWWLVLCCCKVVGRGVLRGRAPSVPAMPMVMGGVFAQRQLLRCLPR